MLLTLIAAMVFATLITAMGGDFPQAISGSRLDSNEILTAIPLFFGSRNSKAVFPIRFYVTGSRKSKMAVVKLEILNISASETRY